MKKGKFIVNPTVMCALVIMMLGAGILPSNAQEPKAATILARPESLRVTTDVGVFNWRKFQYEAEVGVSPIYPPALNGNVPESLVVWIDVETPGASFWVDVSGDGDYERRKYLVWQKGQVQAKGKVRWLVGASVKLTAQSDGITQPVVVEVAFPLLLLLVCCAGGAIGGWFRRSLDPTSKIDVPFTMLPGKWSQKLEPLREAFVSMLVGLLLFVFNAVSPLYLEFRSPDEAQWLGLAHPLLLGFIGGWGGINLLIGLLHLRWGRDR